MTQMIYRPLTNEKRYQGMVVLKATSKGVALDAIIVGEDEVTALCKLGWFPSIDSIFNTANKKRSRKDAPHNKSEAKQNTAEVTVYD